jgi:hypothetical protein
VGGTYCAADPGLCLFIPYAALLLGAQLAAGFLGKRSAADHLKPYGVSTLQRMHLVSTSCLAATTLGALAMFAYDI